MKRFLLLIVLIFGITGYSQQAKLLASCCKPKKETKTVGRCSEDAYCTACSSCRYCAHCSAG